MNLVQASAIFKRIVLGTLAVLLVYVTFLLLRAPLKKLVYTINPPKDLPTALFGKLEAPEFQYKRITNPDPQYILNTKNGRLPVDFPNKMPVFRLRQPLFSYEAGKNAQRTAAILGYYDNSFKSLTTDPTYIWLDPLFNGRLEVNIRTQELKLDVPLFGKSGFYTVGKLNTQTATDQARNMLISAGRFSDMYYSGTVKVHLGKYIGGEVHPVNYDYETQLARVDFFRGFSSFPILGPDPYKGLLHVWVGIPKDNKYKQLIFPKVEAYQWELVDKDKDQNATYPIIPISLAWAEVSANKGVIAGLMAKDGNPFEPYLPIRVDKILVNSIYLAYYDTPKLQKYLQPIYVFEGNYTTVGGGAGEITLYYPAVSGDYILPIGEPNLSE
ncbi:hypothetical protein KJ605_02890 [Patescibacteria group bacterium]|nr:hypothetical protein [Patescibacteria group bacterium]MBU1970689.1 hypothetical protein [Patescibacteria group bacterium]